MLIVLACIHINFCFTSNNLILHLWYYIYHVGFVHTTNLKGTFGGIQCSISIFTDDILNGNVTSSGKEFFAGLTTLSSSIASIDGNLTDLKGNMSALGGTAAGIGANTQTAINTITSVRNIEVANIFGTFDPSYTSPIIGSGGSALTSTFKADLGPHTTTGTLTQKLYASFTEVITNLTAIKTMASNFGSAAGVSTASLNSMKTTVDDLVTNLKDMDKLMKTFLGFLSAPGDYGSVGLQGFYGFLILFSFFTLLGALLTVCCNKYGCRHLMYFSCIFLFIGTLLTFFIAFFFSILVPLFTWTCSYLNFTLDSDPNFKSSYIIIQPILIRSYQLLPLIL
jgi:hypothetical protein